MLRLFVGIGFPPELKLQLSLLCSGIPNARWVDPGNLHLTLRFIGEISEDRAADIDLALTQLRARRFSLSLAGTGVFGGDRPHNLWVGVDAAPVCWPCTTRSSRRWYAPACRRSRANSPLTSPWRGSTGRPSTKSRNFLPPMPAFAPVRCRLPPSA